MAAKTAASGPDRDASLIAVIEMRSCHKDAPASVLPSHGAEPEAQTHTAIAGSQAWGILCLRAGHADLLLAVHSDGKDSTGVVAGESWRSRGGNADFHRDHRSGHRIARCIVMAIASSPTVPRVLPFLRI